MVDVVMKGEGSWPRRSMDVVINAEGSWLRMSMDVVINSEGSWLWMLMRRGRRGRLERRTYRPCS